MRLAKEVEGGGAWGTGDGGREVSAVPGGGRERKKDLSSRFYPLWAFGKALSLSLSLSPPSSFTIPLSSLLSFLSPLLAALSLARSPSPDSYQGRRAGLQSFHFIKK